MNEVLNKYSRDHLTCMALLVAKWFYGHDAFPSVSFSDRIILDFSGILSQSSRPTRERGRHTLVSLAASDLSDDMLQLVPHIAMHNVARGAGLEFGQLGSVTCEPWVKLHSSDRGVVLRSRIFKRMQLLKRAGVTPVTLIPQSTTGYNPTVALDVTSVRGFPLRSGNVNDMIHKIVCGENTKILDSIIIRSHTGIPKDAPIFIPYVECTVEPPRHRYSNKGTLDPIEIDVKQLRSTSHTPDSFIRVEDCCNVHWLAVSGFTHVTVTETDKHGSHQHTFEVGGSDVFELQERMLDAGFVRSARGPKYT